MTDRASFSPPPPPPPSETYPSSPSFPVDYREATPGLSFKCLRCSCVGHLNISDQVIQSSCVCLCCHLADSQCVYCGIDQCIECHEKYILHIENADGADNGHLQSCYFSCSKHCHHQKSAFSDNFNSLSRHRINRRIPPSYKTLLHSSVLANDPDLTWDLLLKGANPFICDATGITPIDLAKLLRSVKIIPTSNEQKIFNILPKISYPDSTIEPPDTRLRTQSDCGPEIPNTFCLSPKKPKMKKHAFRDEKSIIHPAGGTAKRQKSPRRKSKPALLSVSTEFTYRPKFERSMLEASTSPDPPPSFVSPRPIRKKQRSMTLTSQQFPPETPRVHIHNNTFSKATSNLLTKKERAMTLSDHIAEPTTAPSSLATLSYGRARRERAQTITDSSPKKKIVKNGKIVSTSWDTNDDFVSKRPLLRGLVQSGYRLAKSNAPDLLKGKQVFTPMTLLKLSSDNNEISAEDFSAPLISPLQNLRHFQPTMASVVEADAEADSVVESSNVTAVKQNELKASDEWIQWEISQFRDILINEVEVEIPFNQKKTPSRTPSALTSKTGSYADLSNLDKEASLSRNPSQNQLSNLPKSSKGSVSNQDLSTMVGNDSAALPVVALQAPAPVRSHVQGVASRPNTSSPSISKSRINLSHLGNTTSATPPPLAPDATGDDVANAFTVFAQSMNSSSATPPMLPRHMKGPKSGSYATPPKSPAVYTDLDDKLKTRSPAVISELDDRSNFDLNSDSVDISSMDPPSAQQPSTPMDDIILTCTGCYDELPSSQMAYTCSRLGCMSHLCQECIFRSVFVTITSALYAVPRIKCPGRCMHAIPTRIWRGVLRGMKMSDEDKLTVKVEDQYPILRLLDLLYESFELFCSDYEDGKDDVQANSNLMSTAVSGQELKSVHLSDMLKKIETILIQDGYSLLELYNTVYELHDKERRSGEGSDSHSDSDESDDDEEDGDGDEEDGELKILSPDSPRIDITSFEEFAILVYPHKIVPDCDLEKAFLLMEDILNDSEIESNRLGVKKIRKLRLCVFIAHASVIIRSRLDNLSVISPDYVGSYSYVMNIYHNDAESLLVKKYIHNANALLTIRCGGCDETVSLYHIIENGKPLVTEKTEREKVLNKILSQIQPSSPSLTTPTNANLILLFLRNWIHFLTNRIPAVTFISNTISAYLNRLSSVSGNSLGSRTTTAEATATPTPAAAAAAPDNSKLQAMESELELGILPTDLLKFLNSMMSLVLDVERRFAAQLEIYRKYPKIRLSCCDKKHCFLCKVQGHHKGKTCAEMQKTERGLNCQYCPGCGVATLRTEGCTEILCVCGAVWKWKSEEKKSGDGEEKDGEGEGEGNKVSGSNSVRSDESDDDDDDQDDSSSDSWDDDSDDSDDF